MIEALVLLVIGAPIVAGARGLVRRPAARLPPGAARPRPDGPGRDHPRDRGVRRATRCRRSGTSSSSTRSGRTSSCSSSSSGRSRSSRRRATSPTSSRRRRSAPATGAATTRCCLVPAGLAAVPMIDSLGLVWVGIEATTIVSALLVGFTRDRAGDRGGLEVPDPGLGRDRLRAPRHDPAVRLVRRRAGRDQRRARLVPPGADRARSWTRASSASRSSSRSWATAPRPGSRPSTRGCPTRTARRPSPSRRCCRGRRWRSRSTRWRGSTWWPWATLGPAFSSTLLVAFGLLSLAVALPFVVAQGDLKRLLAYSSRGAPRASRRSRSASAASWRCWAHAPPAGPRPGQGDAVRGRGRLSRSSASAPARPAAGIAGAGRRRGPGARGRGRAPRGPAAVGAVHQRGGHHLGRRGDRLGMGGGDRGPAARADRRRVPVPRRPRRHGPPRTRPARTPGPGSRAVARRGPAWRRCRRGGRPGLWTPAPASTRRSTGVVAGPGGGQADQLVATGPAETRRRRGLAALRPRRDRGRRTATGC